MIEFIVVADSAQVVLQEFCGDGPDKVVRFAAYLLGLATMLAIIQLGDRMH